MRHLYWLLILIVHLPFAAFGQINITNPGPICSGALLTQLQATPAGGVWSIGPVPPNPDPSDTTRPLYSNGLFNPHPGMGTVTVTYSVGPNSSSTNITVIDGPSANAGKDTVVCSNVAKPLAIGTPAVGGLQYQWFRGPGTFPANGLSSNTVAQPTVTLTNTGTNYFVVTYYLRVTDPAQTCVAWDSVRVLVFPTTNVTINPGSPVDTVCHTASAYILPTTNPVNGLWYGPGVINPIPGTFQPSNSLEGENILTFVAPCNNPNTTATKKVIVLVPRAEAGPDRQVCASESPFTLTGAPTGGVWQTNTGSVIPGGIIRVPDNLVGERTYYYLTGRPGCVAFDSVKFTFKNVPIVRPHTNVVLCTNSPATELTGASPAGGRCEKLPTDPWNCLSGCVVTPSLSCVGVHVVNYTYTDPTSGCSATASSLVTINRAPDVNAGPDRTICNSSPSVCLTDFTPAGGTWAPQPFVSPGGCINTPNSTFQGFKPLVYSLQVNGCVSRDTIQVEFLPGPGTVTARLDTTVCSNTPRFTLRGSTPAGGKYYNRLGVGPQFGVDSILSTFTPSPGLIGVNTLYYIVRTDRGCTARDSVDITVRDLPRANAGSDFFACSGARYQVGTLRIPNSPGIQYSYAWATSRGLTGIDTLNKAQPGIRFTNSTDSIRRDLIWVRVTQREGTTQCVNIDTAIVSVVPRPDSRTIRPDPNKGCEGDTLLLRAVTNPRYLYEWHSTASRLTPIANRADSILRVTQSGNYYLISIDSIRVRDGVCADTSTLDSIFIKQRNRAQISGQPDFCSTRQDTLIALPTDPANLSYQWLRDSVVIPGATDTLFNANIVGSYQVIVIDARNGITCYDTSAAVQADSIPVPYNDVVRLSNDTTFTVCSGQLPLRLTAPQDTAYPDAFNYLWQNGTIQRNFTIDTTGVYYLTVYNQCGAETDTLRLTSVIPTPVFTILPSGFSDTTACVGIPWTLRGPDGLGITYVWGDAEATPDRELVINTDLPVDSATITLQIIKDFCAYTDTLTYRIQPCDPAIYIPTAFTPQKDEINDRWYIVGYQIDTVSIAIYNRWGQQVYYYNGGDEDMKERNRGWDGSYNSEACTSGTYQYVVEYRGRYASGDPFNSRRTGTLTLIR